MVTGKQFASFLPRALINARAIWIHSDPTIEQP